MTTHQLKTATGVLIADDHDGYRSVAAEVVNATQGFVVAATASDRAQALEAMSDPACDIGLVLMDVNLGEDDGVSVTREITRCCSHVVVLLVSTLALEDLPWSARECGARGYLPKAQLSPSTLMHAGRGVYDWFDDPARSARRRS